MKKLFLTISLLSLVTVGGCNFVSQAQAMGGGAPLTSEELAKHNATLSKLSRDAAVKKAPAVIGAKKPAPVVLHRAVVPQPKAAPLAKTLDPVKAKPTMLERFIALKKRWF